MSWINAAATCPYCKSNVKGGSLVCMQCGAMRNGRLNRSANWRVVILFIPVPLWVMLGFIFAVLAGEPAFWLFYLATSAIGIFLLTFRLPKKVEWTRDNTFILERYRG